MTSTAFLAQILRNLHQTFLAQFWPCWLVLTVVVVAGSVWVVSRSPIPRGRGYERSILRIRQRIAPRAAIVALGVLSAFLVFYIVLILVWEDFAYYDNDFFTADTLKGHNIAPIIWPTAGRFFPLCLQEFNLIRHFTNTDLGYHIFPIIELLIFVFILIILDDELSITARVALAILALLTPSILISFSGLIFQERNELLLLAGLALCVKRFEETESTPWAAGAVLCAQLMLYYKEPAFLLLLGFAAGRLILRCTNADHARWDHDRLWDKEGRLDLSFIGLAVLFLLYYFLAMGLHRKMGYIAGRQQPSVEIVLAYFKLDWLAWLLAAVAMGRMYLILRHRAVRLPLWDGLALGGVAYFLAYLYLRIFQPWYLAPVDLIALLYVGRFAILSLTKTGSPRRVAVFIFVFAVVLQNVFFSAAYLFDRKNGIHAKVEIARVVEEQYRNHAGAPLRLFFPFSDPYVIMEFASYLSYRGIPVEGAEGEGAGLNDVVFAGRAIAANGPCESYRSFRCHPAGRPAPGDLVIVLPDDEASKAEVSAYRVGELLFSYELRLPVPQWVHSLVADLVGNRAALGPTYADKKLPDRWMDASVTIWK